MCHCSSVAQLDLDLTMSINCKVVTLILALTLDGQVHAGTIFGGHETVPHSRPYMALLKRHMKNGKTQHCGGFLLNEDFVMTAAHCQATCYTVVLGVHDALELRNVQNISVDQTFPHRDYNATDYSNDIMILKLSTKAQFNNNVKPIALADHDDDFLPKPCIVSGWGRTSKTINYLSTKLMEVNVTLVHNKRCNKEHSYCSEGVNGPRQGDSGGPLVCEDERAFGLVSSGIHPDSDGQQVYSYAKIPDYIEWIKCIVNNNAVSSNSCKM